MKNLYIACLICASLFTSSNLEAQLLVNDYQFCSKAATKFSVEQFTGTLIKSKLYVKFLIVESEDRSSYTLETSVDGVNFKTDKTLSGLLSPSGVPLLYCYSLEMNGGDDVYIRVKREVNDGLSYTNNLFFKSNDQSEFISLNN